jgi:hypothetical protein
MRIIEDDRFDQEVAANWIKQESELPGRRPP